MPDQTPRWRVIITDSETPSGVAPLCPSQYGPRSPHDLAAYDPVEPPRFDIASVYDCCPGPHLECWTPAAALAVVAVLNAHGVEVCS